MSFKNKNLTIIGLILLMFNYSFSQSITDYKIEIDKELWKTEPMYPLKYIDKKYLNDGNLYIHFQSAFKHDSVQIKINDQLYGIYELTTERSTEVADVIQIPGFDNIKTVSISLNNGKEAVIEINNLNQLIVRHHKKILFIGFRKHVPYYE